MPALSLRGITLEYERAGYVVRPIDGLDLDVDDGELVLLVGASGCGKTTLLSALAALLTPADGTITVGDVEVTGLSGRARDEYRRHGVGIVFQAFNLLPALHAVDNVAVPMWNAGHGGRAAKRRATELLTELGLGERLDHRPADLSGGQQQRVAIARALALDPPLLLADEPTAHLDADHVQRVLKVLRATAQPGRVVVVATHDERMLPIADRVVELSVARATEVAPQLVELSAGEILFREGEPGDVAYVVESGRIELVRQLVDGSEEIVVDAGPGLWFGELAPLYGLPRSATARAAVPTVVTRCSPQQLRHLVRTGSHAERDERDERSAP
ncbi:MAG: ATP-binding cassette domain-containing protein [Ilumatobacteraceae bacterium]